MQSVLGMRWNNVFPALVIVMLFFKFTCLLYILRNTVLKKKCFLVPSPGTLESHDVHEFYFHVTNK